MVRLQSPRGTVVVAHFAAPDWYRTFPVLL